MNVARAYLTLSDMQLNDEHSERLDQIISGMNKQDMIDHFNTLRNKPTKSSYLNFILSIYKRQ